MRTAVISDIHANLVAFQEVLEAIKRLNIERIVCLGDIVGYNPWPNECVQIIRDRSIPCVMGNHDRVAAGLEEPEHFNAAAREAILWTRNVLKNTHRDFLETLPERLSIDDTTIIVHGSPRDPNEYILTTRIAHENIKFMEENLDVSVGFFGHTHVQEIFDIAGGGMPAGETTIYLEKKNRYLINPGSIGQPRDGDPRASFMIFDDKDRSITYFRTAYDIDTVYKAIITEGLSKYLGKRLFLGR